MKIRPVCAVALRAPVEHTGGSGAWLYRHDLCFVYKTRVGIPILALFCLLLISRALAQRGLVREASALFVVGMWIACTLMLVVGGRVTTAFAAIHVSIAVIAGMLLGRRSAIIIAALSTLVSLGLAILQSANYYPLAILLWTAHFEFGYVGSCLRLDDHPLNLTIQALPRRWGAPQKRSRYRAFL